MGSFLTAGDGFHSAHHDFPKHSNHGRYAWYNLDLVYYIICLLEKMGLVWNVTRGENPKNYLNSGKKTNKFIQETSDVSAKNGKED
jgi:fatty-acid desaturase